MIRILNKSVRNLYMANSRLFSTFNFKQSDKLEELSPELEAEFEDWIKNKEAQEYADSENPIFVPIERLKESIREFNQSKAISVFDRFKINNKTSKDKFTVDHSQETKNQISGYCKQLQKDLDVDDHLQKIEHLIYSQFQQNQYNIINQKEFQFILQNKHTQKLIPLFQTRNFFISNPQFLNNQEISQMMQRYQKNNDYCHGLNLIQYNKIFLESETQGGQFLGADQAESFLINNVNKKDFNYLNFAFHIFKLCQKNILKKVNQRDLIMRFLDISVNNNKSFDSVHKDLLINKLKVFQNESIRYFLLDVFFCGNRFEKGITQYCLALCVFARLFEKKVDLQDLFPIVESIFTNKQFELYFVNHLPKVLAQQQDLSLLKKYEDQIYLYNKKQTETLQRITEFDNHLFRKRSFVQIQSGYPIQVQLFFNGNKLRYEIEQGAQQGPSRRDVFQKSFYEKDYKMLGIFIQDQLNTDQDMSNNKIDLNNPEESIKNLYEKLNPQVQEMLNFMDPPKVYFNEIIKENFESQENKQSKQVQIDASRKILKHPKLIQKNKIKQGFCTSSNQFKQFLNQAKKIDEQQILKQSQKNQESTQTDKKIKDQKLDNMLHKFEKPEDQQIFLENFFIKNENLQESQNISFLLLDGRGNLFQKLFYQTQQNHTNQNIAKHLLQSKDYNSYLQNNIFDFQIKNENYQYLLKQMEQNFNKKQFKKIIAHYMKYNTTYNQKTLQNFLQIINKQKLGETLFDFVSMIQSFDNQTVRILLPQLARYKNHQTKVFELIQNLIEQDKLEFESIELYVKQIIDLKQPNEFMSLFEKLKIYMLSRRFKGNENLSPDQVIIQQNKFKIDNNQQLVKFYSQFTQYLCENNFLQQAKLCFMDHIAQKFELTKQDYTNGLKGNYFKLAFSDDSLQIVKIFNHMETNLPKSIDSDIILLLQDPINNDVSNMKEFFVKIFNDYIMIQQLNSNYINMALRLLIKYPKSTQFASLLKRVINENIQLQNNSKILCYKTLQSDPDETSKSYIKGLIDKIFSEENKKRLEQNKKYKKNEKTLVQEVKPKEQPKQEQNDKDNELFVRIIAPQLQFLDSIFNRKGKRKLNRERSPAWDKFKAQHEELGIAHLKERK